MNTIIVDNEKKIVEGLEILLNSFLPEINIVGSAGTIAGALSLIKQSNIDLLFLDIELDDGTGMELLKQIKNRNFQVIFITAYDQYAIEAFKYSAIDFLLKPIDPDDLIAAVSRAKKEVKKEHLQLRMETFLDNVSNVSAQDKKIIVSDKDHIHALSINDILYMEADGAYTKIKLIDKTIVSSKNLKNYQTLLANTSFFRSHHSYLVNLTHMLRFDKADGVLVLSNNQQVSVSFRKKEALLDQMKQIAYS